MAATVEHAALGPFNRNLNRFLAKAVEGVRRHFHGPVTYASGTWESVDWTPFDFVSIDCYRDAMNKKVFHQNLRKYLVHGKPVVITEFGGCTYRGAEDKGALTPTGGSKRQGGLQSLHVRVCAAPTRPVFLRLVRE